MKMTKTEKLLKNDCKQNDCTIKMTYK